MLLPTPHYVRCVHSILSREKFTLEFPRRLAPFGCDLSKHCDTMFNPVSKAYNTRKLAKKHGVCYMHGILRVYMPPARHGQYIRCAPASLLFSLAAWRSNACQVPCDIPVCQVYIYTRRSASRAAIRRPLCLLKNKV